MYCLMGGNKSAINQPVKYTSAMELNFFVHCLVSWDHGVLSNWTALIKQYRTKVANYCSWCPYYPLVPITLCSLSAAVCYGGTRDNRSTPHDCTQCSELHHISNIVRLVLVFYFVSVGRLSSWFSNKRQL